MIKRILLIILTILIIFLGSALLWKYYRINRPKEMIFDAQRAYQHVLAQTDFGPRTPGSAAHTETIEYIRTNLEQSGWLVDIQTEKVGLHTIKNIIARRSDVPPQIILGAHYDTRLLSDKDPDLLLQQQPVPGGNDGASGVAVLLELGRVLPGDSVPVWLVFFDAEDQGGIPGWDDWSLGAQAFVDSYNLKPRAVVIVDMVGDFDLNITIEKNSDSRLTKEIWDVAASLGYGNVFIPLPKYNIVDDHIPFVNAGIPAVDIIDIEYRYWHTTYDTADKVSAHSLEIVGNTLLAWIAQQNR